VIWSWGPLQITTVGLTVLGSVTLKALLSADNECVNSDHFDSSAAACLGSAATTVSASCDYGINVSLHQCLNWEFNAMRRAAASRNLMGSNRWQRFSGGNMIGSLFIRTYERGIGFIRRCCHAGIKGYHQLKKIPQGGKQDILALTVILALLGQVIYWPNFYLLCLNAP